MLPKFKSHKCKHSSVRKGYYSTVYCLLPVNIRRRWFTKKGGVEVKKYKFACLNDLFCQIFSLRIKLFKAKFYDRIETKKKPFFPES